MGLLKQFKLVGPLQDLNSFEQFAHFFKRELSISILGPMSVWILDGALIHIDDDAMIDYLFSVGVDALFLPSYCPFFNPIEYVFGVLKSQCKKLQPKRGEEEFA